VPQNINTPPPTTTTHRLLTQKMFTLSSKTSLPHALFTAKHPRQKTSSNKRCATTKAVVNDSPRIIVENDAETKKFRLRDHQREVIRDMSGFAGGEVRIIYTRVLFTPPSFSSTKRFQNSSSVCDRRVYTMKQRAREREKFVSRKFPVTSPPKRRER
jgi:hypothetical protein